MSIVSAQHTLTCPFDNSNGSAARAVGDALVSAMKAILKEYDVALVTVAERGLRAVVQVHNGSAACPTCGRLSWRVSSRYWRSVADVTGTGMHVELKVYARRFRCQNPACSQRVFAERLPDIPAWARRSNRITSLLAATALANGGLPGRRIARLYGLNYSRHTLLRATRQVTMEECKTVRVLGVDDYAYRRGVNYGTLLYSHDEHRVIDLLPERSAELLAAWLMAHPGVEVISRDRGGIYAQGAREGAPQAIQVADRFHLMQNLGDVLERIAQKGIRLEPEHAPEIDPSTDPSESQPPPTPSRAELTKAARERRQSRQDDILDLHRQGMSIRTIAATLHLGRPTIRRYLARLPDNTRPRQPSICDPYKAYLQQRWDSGVHNGHQLYQEIKARGYTGSESGLRHYLGSCREHMPRDAHAAHGSSKKPSKPEVISPRAFRRLVVRNLRTAAEDALLDRIVASDPLLATSVTLAHHFAAAIRSHDVNAFDAWLDGATKDGGPGWRPFVEGLRRDIAAVHNAITLSWSQGPVEGSIHRLKLIKRAMYGRGGTDLLRRRVIFHLPD